MNRFFLLFLLFLDFCEFSESLTANSEFRHERIVENVGAANPGEYPFLVSIRQLGSFGKTHICGGSIYNSKYVLTAATCVKNVHPSNLTVVAGEHQLSSMDPYEQERGILQVKTHWLYNGRTKENDIALLEVDIPFAINDYVAIANLPPLDEEVNEGLEATIVGWGTTSFNDALLSDIPQKTIVPVVSDSSCRLSYSGSDIADSMICAGGGSAGFCQADTGGPLLLGSSKKQIGIISWSTGCAYPGYPGVYTQVSYYIDWIQNNTE